MAEIETHVIVLTNGVLIPRELFGNDDQVLAELKETGVLSELSNGSQRQSGVWNLKPPREALPIDLSRELLWLKEHRHEHIGEWIALDGARLLSHGADAREVAAAARAAGVAAPFITQVDPPEELPFGGW